MLFYILAPKHFNGSSLLGKNCFKLRVNQLIYLVERFQPYTNLRFINCYEISFNVKGYQIINDDILPRIFAQRHPHLCASSSSIHLQLKHTSPSRTYPCKASFKISLHWPNHRQYFDHDDISTSSETSISSSTLELRHFLLWIFSTLSR